MAPYARHACETRWRSTRRRPLGIKRAQHTSAASAQHVTPLVMRGPTQMLLCDPTAQLLRAHSSVRSSFTEE